MRGGCIPGYLNYDNEVVHVFLVVILGFPANACLLSLFLPHLTLQILRSSSPRTFPQNILIDYTGRETMGRQTESNLCFPRDSCNKIARPAKINGLIVTWHTIHAAFTYELLALDCLLLNIYICSHALTRDKMIMKLTEKRNCHVWNWKKSHFFSFRGDFFYALIATWRFYVPGFNLVFVTSGGSNLPRGSDG